eukprot:TRINITY_DN4809_c0_g2_i1.p1 TRINITY_DN4809_c0_g2~~TRINITY_DN4809_c0_g2_i1.p1  ORF type:complete len:429 (+),score=52.79 TRINITY_DN4809_c0_g2_i1:64-1350(+)
MDAGERAGSPSREAYEKKVCYGKVPMFLSVIPMCLTEFLSFTITRAVIPGMQAQTFGAASYRVEGYTLAVQGILSFFFCPIFGAVSDVYGRCVPLAVAALGAMIPVVALMLGSNMLTYQVLVALSGILKGTFVVVFAFVADTTPQGPKRTNAYGVVLGTLGLSLTVGPYLGGMAAAAGGNIAAFKLTTLLGFSAMMYSLVFLPESLPRRGKEMDWSAANPFRVMAWVWNDQFLRHLMTIAFLYFISYWSLVSSIMLYLTRKFHYGVMERGRFLSLIGFCHMMSEFIIVRVCMKFGVKDKILMQVGLAGWVVKMCLFTVATTKLWLDVAALMSLVSGVFGPAFVSLASSAAEIKGKQGEVQGAIAAFRALAEGLGPLFMGILFSINEGGPEGTPYAIGACIACLSLSLTLKLPELPPEKYEEEPPPSPH